MYMAYKNENTERIHSL